MPRKADGFVAIHTDRKPRERKSLAQRIDELKQAKAAHEARAEAVDGRIRALLAEQKAKADAILAAVQDAGE